MNWTRLWFLGIAHFWEGRSRAVRSVFYYKKLPYGPIYPWSILTISTSRNEVALRTMTTMLIARTTSTMEELWRVELGPMITEVGRDIYLISFEDPVDRDEVIAKEPWSFNNSLIIFKPIQDVRDTNWGNYSLTSFWIQWHNLPVHG